MADDTTDFPAREKCAIAGIGRTAYTRDSGESVLSLATKAAPQWPPAGR